MTRRTRVFGVVGAVLGLFVAYEIASRLIAFTDDAYVRSDLIAVAPQVTGRIVAVHVHDNQAVQAGDGLFTIDPTPFELVIAQRRAEIGQARALLRADQDVIAAAADAIASANSAQEFAQETRRRISALTEADVASRQSLDQADDAVRRAAAALAGAQARAKQAAADAAGHQAALARAEAEMATSQWQLARTRVVAPAAGTINNLTVRAGDTANADVPLIGIVDAHAWRIIANYKQSYLRELRIGGTAWVWLDSEPWHLHRARIAGIARGISREPEAASLLPYVAPTTDWIRLQRRFPVTLLLDDPPATLALYMGADARVVIFP